MHRLDRAAGPRGDRARVRPSPAVRPRRRPAAGLTARAGAAVEARVAGVRGTRGSGRRGRAAGGELIPVDSEHSAALQCLGGRPAAEIERLTLTASGGPLRRHPDWRRATRAEVLAHPVWAMGERITVDSATLFNKGLE